MTDDPKTTNGPRIKFPCGHIIGVLERSLLDPFRCPICRGTDCAAQILSKIENRRPAL